MSHHDKYGEYKKTGKCKKSQRQPVICTLTQPSITDVLGKKKTNLTHWTERKLKL